MNKTDYIPQLIMEAVIVGLLFIAFYQIVQIAMPKMTLMYKLFLAGVIGHLGLEFVGINKYYCKHSYAVKSCTCGCSASKEARGEVERSCGRK